MGWLKLVTLVCESDRCENGDGMRCQMMGDVPGAQSNVHSLVRKSTVSLLYNACVYM